MDKENIFSSKIEIAVFVRLNVSFAIIRKKQVSKYELSKIDFYMSFILPLALSRNTNYKKNY
jgi:hypothetical protein